MSQLSIAITFYNEEKNIKACLESLHTDIKEFSEKVEIILINNHSTDKSSDVVRLWKSENPQFNIKIIERDRNHLALARQQALDEASSHFLVFIDADARVEPGWINGIFSTINDWPEDVGAYGGSSQYKGEMNWHPFAISLSKLFPWGRSGGEKKQVSHMPTNNYLLKKKCALNVGGFHPLFAFVGEDLDFNIRLNDKYKIYFTPNFSVSHELPTSYRAWLRKMAYYGRAQSLVFLRNRGGLSINKFFPLFFSIGLSMGLIFSPLVSQILFLLAVIIPRLRFLMFSFLFYGFGEFVGFFMYIFNYRLAHEKTLAEPPRHSLISS